MGIDRNFYGRGTCREPDGLKFLGRPQQSLSHLARRPPAQLDLFCESSFDNGGDFYRDFRNARGDRNYRLFEYGLYRFRYSRFWADVERMGAGQQAVRRHSDRINVRRRPHFLKIPHLLGRHVGYRARDVADHRHAAHSGLFIAFRQSKIRQLCDQTRILAVDQNVLLLDIAMYESEIVRQNRVRPASAR